MEFVKICDLFTIIILYWDWGSLLGKVFGVSKKVSHGSFFMLLEIPCFNVMSVWNFEQHQSDDY